MPRYDDDLDEDDDRPPRKRNQESGISTTAIILIALGVGGLVMFGCLGVMIALLLPAVQQARNAARTTQSMNNLRQIGLAIHNFNDAMGHLPPRDPSQDLKPGDIPQSWMTELLPYVEQVNVYNLLNRQAAWDDASNRQVMSLILPVYLDPNLQNESTDSMTGFGLAHYAGNIHIFGGEKPRRLQDFTDGTSNTMLAGSVTKGLRPWGDPGNLRDPAAGIGPGASQFSGNSAGQTLILLADGSVRRVQGNVSPQVMQGLAKPSDNAVPPDGY